MEALSWLLEPDPENPGVRYFALRRLLDRAVDDPEVRQAQAAVMAQGPVPVILAAQSPDGSWPASITSYKGTAKQVELLAELGADPADERVQRAGRYMLEHYIAANGGIAYDLPPVPSRVVHCHGSMHPCALQMLGFGSDPRLQGALEWQARAVLNELPAGQRYYKSGTSGPGFSCGYNQQQPCAWGATKALRAFLSVPEDQRAPLLRRAIQAGADFLLSCDLAQADYPYTGKVSPAWFRLVFPFSFWSDVLETAGVLVELGYADRIAAALDVIRSKQDAQGRWALEYSFNGKMWVDIEWQGQPSKWVTLRALSVLRPL
jgi:hypothetical protein